jgi:hypothetical protein
MNLATLPPRPIVFIENREKTLFWAAVARDLEQRGHPVHWIVQNHAFGKGLPGTVHRIPYPRSGAAGGDGADWAERFPVLVTDRGRQYFETGTTHYAHYADHIRRVLEQVGPGLVIGESTLFHELLAVSVAEELGVPFIHPAAERYPQDRFVMFSGTSQVALVESNAPLAPGDALSFARRVQEGTERPAYMQRPSGFEKLTKRLKWLWTRGSIWQARLAGERYNTPSLARKWHLARWAKGNLAAWTRLARAVPSGTRAVMYPMHVAPEANIDVWGRPFNDQTALIKRLLAACPPDVAVAVKANPSPKYEITDELIELAEREPRLVLLPLGLPMAEAMAQTVGAITVSGTVAFEAALGKGRCLALCHPVLDAACPAFTAATPEEGVRLLLEEPARGLGDDASAVALLQAITARSFKGFISDPFSTPACLAADNTRNVADAIAYALRRVSPASVSAPVPAAVSAATSESRLS